MFEWWNHSNKLKVIVSTLTILVTNKFMFTYSNTLFALLQLSFRCITFWFSVFCFFPDKRTSNSMVGMSSVIIIINVAECIAIWNPVSPEYRARIQYNTTCVKHHRQGRQVQLNGSLKNNPQSPLNSVFSRSWIHCKCRWIPYYWSLNGNKCMTIKLVEIVNFLNCINIITLPVILDVIWNKLETHNNRPISVTLHFYIPIHHH